MSSSQEVPEEVPPALPPRSTQRDSRGSPQVSPVQSTHPVPAEGSSSQAETPPPQVPAKHEARPQTQTHAQQVQGLFPNVAPLDTVKTKRQELSEGDRLWQWKIGFRAAAIIVGLIGIGCAGWIVANFSGTSDLYSYSYIYLDDAWIIPYTLITFGVSVIWCAICVVVFFTRKLNRPVHPGAQVGIDLILWLGLLGTGIMAIFATVSVSQFGEDGRLGFSSSDSGAYTQADDGTWVWDASSYSSYYGEDRSCNSTQSARYYSRFDSCEEQDAWVNAIWKAQTTRHNVDTVVTVCQFLALLFHLILFVWACVDTHRRNTRGVTKDAEKLAAEIVMNMVKSGAVIPAPGQAHFRPMPMAQQGAGMGYYPPQQHMQHPHQYPQGFQPYPPQQYPGQHPSAVAQGKAPVPQIAVSSSDEKGARPRYA